MADVLPLWSAAARLSQHFGTRQMWEPCVVKVTSLTDIRQSFSRLSDVCWKLVKRAWGVKCYIWLSRPWCDKLWKVSSYEFSGTLQILHIVLLKHLLSTNKSTFSFISCINTPFITYSLLHTLQAVNFFHFWILSPSSLTCPIPSTLSCTMD